MTEAKPKQTERKIEEQIEIAAPAETVWKALTNAEGLKRWFPLEERIASGKGGKMVL